jgi:hypothetical protein
MNTNWIVHIGLVLSQGVKHSGDGILLGITAVGAGMISGMTLGSIPGMIPGTTLGTTPAGAGDGIIPGIMVAIGAGVIHITTVPLWLFAEVVVL